MSGPNAPAAVGQQNYRTPDAVLDACLRRFGLPYFAWDLACSEHDCVGLNGGFEHPRVDALKADWAPLARLRGGKGVCWLNPPFAKSGKFCQLAADAADHGVRTVALVPVALGTRWWKRYVHRRAVVVGVGRCVFNNPDGSPVQHELKDKQGNGTGVWKDTPINRDVAVLAYGLDAELVQAPHPFNGEWYLLEDWRTW